MFDPSTRAVIFRLLCMCGKTGLILYRSDYKGHEVICHFHPTQRHV